MGVFKKTLYCLKSNILSRNWDLFLRVNDREEKKCKMLGTT